MILIISKMASAEKNTTKEIGLKTVFTLLVNGLFSAFFVTSGMLNFKEKKILAGLLYLVLAVLALVPHKFMKVSQALKIIILVILFVILATFAAKGDPIKEQKSDNFSMGQKFDLVFGSNKFSMVVKEIKSDASISVSGKEVTTTGSFIIVTGDIENLGNKAVDFKFTKDPELKDGQNRLYTLYGAAVPVGKLQPSVAKEVSYVFEIPKDATGLKFIVKDKTDVFKSIDLKK